MSPSGVTLNKPVAIGFLILVAGGIIVYKYYWTKEPSSPSRVIQGDRDGRGDDSVLLQLYKPEDDNLLLLAEEADAVLFSFKGHDESSGTGVSKEVDVATLPDFPNVSAEDLKKVQIVKSELTVQVGGKEFKVVNRQTATDQKLKLTVLLLHGMVFSSETWVETNTLQYLASWGFRAIAIDLPEGSKSKTTGDLGEISKSDFLSAVIAALKSEQKPVIISPSMSGSFALPYLFQDPAKSMERALGYVPVAPVDADKYTEQYPKSQLPTLIVYGAKDHMGPSTAESLKLLPQSKIAVIPDAGHPCYKDQPDLFHKALYQFLTGLVPA